MLNSPRSFVLDSDSDLSFNNSNSSDFKSGDLSEIEKESQYISHFIEHVVMQKKEIKNKPFNHDKTRDQSLPDILSPYRDDVLN